jgi:predicted nucleotide-binding protein
MYEIPRDIPNVDDVLALDRKELGAKLLFRVRERLGSKEFHPGNLNLELWPQSYLPGHKTPYPEEQRTEIERAFSEAWAWLQTQGWIVPYPNAGTGWMRISREAERVTSETEVIQDAVTRMVSKGGEKMDQFKGNGSTAAATATSAADPTKLSRKVFIVHGRDDGARETVARFLERLEFEPIILHEQASRGRTVIEKVEAHGDLGFAVVLLTPDDEGGKKGGTLRPRARQNVLLELGYFIGRLGRSRVCALKRGDSLEIPSDFGGVVYVPFDDTGGWKEALGRELEAAGFEIDWNKGLGKRRDQ